MLFKAVKPEDGVVCQYVGVYLLKWRSEWGIPEIAFVEATPEEVASQQSTGGNNLEEAIEIILSAAKRLARFCEKGDTIDFDNEYDQAEGEEIRKAISAFEEAAQQSVQPTGCYACADTGIIRCDGIAVNCPVCNPATSAGNVEGG